MLPNGADDVDLTASDDEACVTGFALLTKQLAITVTVGWDDTTELG